MSLATDAKGRVYVLDQVNHRVTRRGVDGSVEATFPVDLRAAQDVAIAGDGSLVVLDRLGDKKLAMFDDGGRLRGEVPLTGPEVGNPSYITGVFLDGKDVYVEKEHGALVKIADSAGAPATPVEVPGRPSRDGALWLHAGIVDAAKGRAFVAATDRATGDHRFTRELKQQAELRSIQLLDTDRAGIIYFAVELHLEPATDWVALWCLEPQHGQPVGATSLPANTLPEESFRDLTVLDRGGVVYAIRSEQGVEYRVYECQ
jgi:hypothetical protein